jgi:hypothetical protein
VSSTSSSHRRTDPELVVDVELLLEDGRRFLTRGHPDAVGGLIRERGPLAPWLEAWLEGERWILDPTRVIAFRELDE